MVAAAAARRVCEAVSEEVKAADSRGCCSLRAVLTSGGHFAKDGPTCLVGTALFTEGFSCCATLLYLHRVVAVSAGCTLVSHDLCTKGIVATPLLQVRISLIVPSPVSRHLADLRHATQKGCVPLSSIIAVSECVCCLMKIALCWHHPLHQVPWSEFDPHPVRAATATDCQVLSPNPASGSHGRWLRQLEARLLDDGTAPLAQIRMSLNGPHLHRNFKHQHEHGRCSDLAVAQCGPQHSRTRQHRGGLQRCGVATGRCTRDDLSCCNASWLKPADRESREDASPA